MSEEVVQEGAAEKLMGALINKMESMDQSLSLLKAENVALKNIVADPAMLLKRATVEFRCLKTTLISMLWIGPIFTVLQKNRKVTEA